MEPAPEPEAAVPGVPEDTLVTDARKVLAQLRLSPQQKDQFRDISAAKALASRLVAALDRAGIDIWGGCRCQSDMGSADEQQLLPLLQLNAQAHAMVARIAREHPEHGACRSVKNYWAGGKVDPTAVSYAAVAIHCDPTDPDALYEAAVEYGLRGELRKSQQCLEDCVRATHSVQQQSQWVDRLKKDVQETQNLLDIEWGKVEKAAGKGSLEALWGAGRIASQATDDEIQKLLDSPPSGHPLYKKNGDLKKETKGGLDRLTAKEEEKLRSTVKELFPESVQAFATADPALQLGPYRQKAKTIVNAYNTERPLLPVPTLERQDSSSVVGLGIGTWNVRAYSPGLHHIPCKDSAEDKSLPRKMDSLWEVVSASRLQLMALQECPGRAAGYNTRENVEERLRAAAVRTGSTQFNGWTFRSALCGKESATFVYNETVLQMIGSPEPYEQSDIVVDGDHTDEETEQVTEVEDDTSGEMIAQSFRRPPVLALFGPTDTPDGHLFASPHGRLAVVSVHLKSFDGSLAQTKAEVRALAELVVPWMEKAVAAAAVSEPRGSVRVTTYIIMGDFNLSEATSDRFTAGGDAWAPLKGCGFEPLMEAGEPTNMGPPVSQHHRCYDNILYRRRVDATATVGELRPVLRRARVFPVMREEMEEMNLLRDALNNVRTDEGRGLVSKFVQVEEMDKAFKHRAFTRWSDHKPVYIRLLSETESDVKGRADCKNNQ